MSSPKLSIRIALLSALLLAACGDGPSSPPATTDVAPAQLPTTTVPPACAAAVREPLDSASGVHVLPGAPEPAYSTDPPTSGAHQSGAVPQGVVAEPIPRPVQVAILEGGTVLIQHRGLAAADRAALEALAGAEITVAPAAALPGAIVATAWQAKLVCQQLDVPALKAFAAEHAGRADDH